jgi:hypothetical protein
MKYSPEQVKLFEDTIYDIVCRDPGVSTRSLCYELEQQHIKLNRAYATKLMWKACRKLTDKKSEATERRAEFDAWKEKLGSMIHEIDALKFKILELIQSYPGDIPDPKNLERF